MRRTQTALYVHEVEWRDERKDSRAYAPSYPRHPDNGRSQYAISDVLAKLSAAGREDVVSVVCTVRRRLAKSGDNKFHARPAGTISTGLILSSRSRLHGIARELHQFVWGYLFRSADRRPLFSGSRLGNDRADAATADAISSDASQLEHGSREW